MVGSLVVPALLFLAMAVQANRWKRVAGSPGTAAILLIVANIAAPFALPLDLLDPFVRGFLFLQGFFAALCLAAAMVWNIGNADATEILLARWDIGAFAGLALEMVLLQGVGVVYQGMRFPDHAWILATVAALGVMVSSALLRRMRERQLVLQSQHLPSRVC